MRLQNPVPGPGSLRIGPVEDRNDRTSPSGPSYRSPRKKAARQRRHVEMRKVMRSLSRADDDEPPLAAIGDMARIPVRERDARPSSNWPGIADETGRKTRSGGGRGNCPTQQDGSLEAVFRAKSRQPLLTSTMVPAASTRRCSRRNDSGAGQSRRSMRFERLHLHAVDMKAREEKAPPQQTAATSQPCVQRSRNERRQRCVRKRISPALRSNSSGR